MANKNIQILEKGDIYFFYRPKVGSDFSHSQKGVQRMYFVLSPEHGKKRLIIIGQKELPERKNRDWGFVDRVGNEEDIKEELSADIYETKTRGIQKTKETRPAGEGVYEIVRHGNHTHLAYALELPKKTGEVQKGLQIHEQGNFIVTVKNPQKGAPAKIGLRKEQKAELPENLMKKFENKRFFLLDPEFLNYEGTELILIDTGKNISDDLGVKLNPEDEDMSSAEIFRDLKLDKNKHPMRPLFQGEWE